MLAYHKGPEEDEVKEVEEPEDDLEEVEFYFFVHESMGLIIDFIIDEKHSEVFV